MSSTMVSTPWDLKQEKPRWRKQRERIIMISTCSRTDNIRKCETSRIGSVKKKIHSPMKIVNWVVIFVK